MAPWRGASKDPLQARQFAPAAPVVTRPSLQSKTPIWCCSNRSASLTSLTLQRGMGGARGRLETVPSSENYLQFLSPFSAKKTAKMRRTFRSEARTPWL